jgi:hypothetical protein
MQRGRFEDSGRCNRLIRYDFTSFPSFLEQKSLLTGNDVGE